MQHIPKLLIWLSIILLSFPLSSLTTDNKLEINIPSSQRDGERRLYEGRDSDVRELDLLIVIRVTLLHLSRDSEDPILPPFQ